MLKELQVSTIQDDCGSSFKVRLRERERERERESRQEGWKGLETEMPWVTFKF